MRCLMRRPSRSACSSSAGSGRRTRRSTAASATPICRSGRSPIRAPASTAAAGACCWALIFLREPTAYEFTSMPPAERVARAVEFGSRIHPQYAAEFENGIAVAWHRVAVHAGMRRLLDRRSAGRALRQSVPDRRQDRAGRRARLLHSGLAGGRDPLVARCHHAAARTRRQDVMRCAKPGQTSQIEFVTISTSRFSVAAARLICLGAACTRMRTKKRVRGLRRRSARASDSRNRPAKNCSPVSARAATCLTARARAAPAPIRRSRKTAISRPAVIRFTSWSGDSGRCRRSARMMSDDQVAAVVNYVRTHFGNNYRDAVTRRRRQARPAIEQ